MAIAAVLAASSVKKFTWEHIRQRYQERIAQLTEVEKVGSELRHRSLSGVAVFRATFLRE